MKFYIVDAFTETTFGGNPAGVVILPEGSDFPSDETMVKTAAELRYSETAFIRRLNQKEFQIRYFTPAAEVELCGHATIGSFCALLYGGYIEDNCTYMNHTLSGDLNIAVNDGFVLMDMAEPVKINEISDPAALEELYRIMGLSYEEQKSRGVNLLPQMISTGLPDIMMPVATQADLAAIAPDFPALSALSERYEVVGVHAFTLDGEGDAVKTTCHVRNFAPLYDIDEEALEEEAARAEKQLRERLVENRKSVGAFCYVNGITEDQLFAYCKANLVRTALENATILSIAEIEGIKVTEKDLAAYKQNYREQYARVLLTEPDFGEEELVEEICARKVLNFLKDNNTAQRKGDW